MMIEREERDLMRPVLPRMQCGDVERPYSYDDVDDSARRADERSARRA